MRREYDIVQLEQSAILGRRITVLPIYIYPGSSNFLLLQEKQLIKNEFIQVEFH
jgi:hypothetical protein